MSRDLWVVCQTALAEPDVFVPKVPGLRERFQSESGWRDGFIGEISVDVDATTELDEEFLSRLEAMWPHRFSALVHFEGRVGATDDWSIAEQLAKEMAIACHGAVLEEEGVVFEPADLQTEMDAIDSGIAAGEEGDVGALESAIDHALSTHDARVWAGAAVRLFDAAVREPQERIFVSLIAKVIEHDGVIRNYLTKHDRDVTALFKTAAVRFEEPRFARAADELGTPISQRMTRSSYPGE